jgi:membrane protein
MQQQETGFLDSKYLSGVKNFLLSIRFPGTNVTWYDVLGKFVNRIVNYDIDQRATSVAYGFTLALFPLILFLFTLIPYIPIPNLESQIMEFLHDFMPDGIYEFTEQTIRDIVSRPQAGVLSFGFLLALYGATNGMVSLMRSFNMLNGKEDSRSFIQTRGTAIMLMILMALVLFLSVVLVIVGDAVMAFVIRLDILNSSLTVFALNLLRYAISILSLGFGISIIYRFAPDIKSGIRFVNFGAILSSFLIVLVTFGFSYYLSNFSSYNKLYGSIGTIIALMLWLYLLALILIFGYEVNVSIQEAKRNPISKTPTE